MLNVTEATSDAQSLATFRSHPEELLSDLQRTGRSVTLTVDGVPAAVFHSAEAHQRLLDIAAQADIHEAIRQGDEGVAAGRTHPVSEVFEEIRQRHSSRR